MRTVNFRPLGATFLIAGTAVGAGMLVLPVDTSLYGFFPAIFWFILTWFVMVLAGFLWIEASFNLPNAKSIIMMAKRTLGWQGFLFCLCCYLLLLYALVAAYLSGLADILWSIPLPYVGQFLGHEFSGLSVHFHSGLWLFCVACFAGVLFAGVLWIDQLNRFLFIMLVVMFFLLALILMPLVNTHHFVYQAWKGSWLVLPLVITAFGFHIIIPSLRGYLNGDLLCLKKVVFLGSLIPLLIYLLWEFLVLGSLPLQGIYGLWQVLHSSHSASALVVGFAHYLHSDSISWVVRLFALCALVTSLVGVGLSLFDCLFELVPLKAHRLKRFYVALLTLIPPVFFVHYYPSGLIAILKFAGVFAAVLLGLLPVAIVAALRRRQQQERSIYQVRGGQLTLWLVGLFSVAVIVIEIFR